MNLARINNFYFETTLWMVIKGNVIEALSEYETKRPYLESAYTVLP